MCEGNVKCSSHHNNFGLIAWPNTPIRVQTYLSIIARNSTETKSYYRGEYSHYSGGEESYKRVSDDRDNEILGSGNFDVIKGGTFYDPGTYYNLRYNSRPKQNGYNADFLDNFRDFADIKNDHIRRRSRY